MLIITVRSGQLCNRLVQFAHLIAFCKHRNLKVMNLAFAEYAQYFSSTGERLFISFPPSRFRLRNRLVRTSLQRVFHILGFFAGRLMSKFRGVALVRFDNEGATAESVARLESALRNRLVFVEGWYFRDPIDFSRYADYIRHYFQPKERFVKASHEIMRKIRNNSDVVVGLHIRRGDYKCFQGGKFYFDDQVYVRIIQDLIGQFPGKRVKVFVASNEPLQLQNYVSVSESIVWEIREPIVDLYTLALCDYIVGPPSTFSAWASFYGKVPLLPVETPEGPIDLQKASPCHQ